MPAREAKKRKLRTGGDRKMRGAFSPSRCSLLRLLEFQGAEPWTTGKGTGMGTAVAWASPCAVFVSLAQLPRAAYYDSIYTYILIYCFAYIVLQYIQVFRISYFVFRFHFFFWQMPFAFVILAALVLAIESVRCAVSAFCNIYVNFDSQRFLPSQ